MREATGRSSADLIARALLRLAPELPAADDLNQKIQLDDARTARFEAYRRADLVPKMVNDWLTGTSLQKHWPRKEMVKIYKAWATEAKILGSPKAARIAREFQQRARKGISDLPDALDTFEPDWKVKLDEIRTKFEARKIVEEHSKEDWR